jgi:pimeloyl-ACP methyl ester carboxylesterase
VEAGLARLTGGLSAFLDAGHYTWIDDPEAFLELLQEALPPT